MKRKLLNTIYFLRDFLISKYFMAVSLGAACLITVLRAEVAGAIIFACAISLIWIISDDFMATLLPFMLMCEFLCKMYNSFNTFIKLWPFAFLIVGSLIFHLVFYRKKIKLTPIFWTLCIISVAVTCGGLFTKGAWKNVNMSGFYYIAGLGIGMVLAYLIFNAHLTTDRGYNIKLKFAYIMMLAGVYACFMVIEHYFSLIQELGEINKVVYFQWKNNISTFLMICMPFPFYLSMERTHSMTFHRFWLGVLLYGCILLSPSRGGYVFGSVEFIICLVYTIYADKPNRQKNLFNIFVLMVVAGLITFSAKDFVFSIFGSIKIDKNEARIQLYKRAIGDFFKNPVFGVGLAYSGNDDVWTPTVGAINWTNCSVFQVIGSFGIVGIIAYLYQILSRVRCLITVRSKFNLCIFISYIGITMMGLVNPAQFCPIPYLTVVTMMFVITEKCNEDELQRLKQEIPYDKKGLLKSPVKYYTGALKNYLNICKLTKQEKDR